MASSGWDVSTKAIPNRAHPSGDPAAGQRVAEIPPQQPLETPSYLVGFQCQLRRPDGPKGPSGLPLRPSSTLQPMMDPKHSGLAGSRNSDRHFSDFTRLPAEESRLGPDPSQGRPFERSPGGGPFKDRPSLHPLIPDGSASLVPAIIPPKGGSRSDDPSASKFDRHGSGSPVGRRGRAIRQWHGKRLKPLGSSDSRPNTCGLARRAGIQDLLPQDPAAITVPKPLV